MGLKLIKFRQWSREWRVSYGAALRGLASSYGAFGIVTGTLTIWLLLEWGTDANVITEELQSQWAGALVAFGAFSFWAFLNIFISMFAATRRVQEFGIWYGNKFIYKQPSIEAVFSVSRSQAPFRKTVTIKGAFSYSLVKCRVETDNQHWNGFVLPIGGTDLSFGGGQVLGHTAAMLSSKKELVIKVECYHDQADDVTVRLVVDSWMYQEKPA